MKRKLQVILCFSAALIMVWSYSALAQDTSNTNIVVSNDPDRDTRTLTPRKDSEPEERRTLTPRKDSEPEERRTLTPIEKSKSNTDTAVDAPSQE